MKFTTNTQAILKNLQLISGSLGTHLPVLECVHFQLNGDTLKLTASDLETTMTASMTVSSKDSGAFLVPAKILIEALKTFQDQPITFIAKEQKVEIKTENGNFKLTGNDVNDYPVIPSVTGETMTIQSEVLSDAISKTIFATSEDELRPILGGVLFEIRNQSATFVSTDSHRLVRFIEPIKSKNAATFVIPKKALQLLSKTITGDAVEIQYNESNAVFTIGQINLTCRLVDGKYPNYDAVIPKDNPNQMKIERLPFLSAIKRVSVFSNKTTHQVKFKIAGGEISIHSEDVEFNSEAVEKIKCEYKGKDMEIGFNGKYLAEILTNLDSQNVVVEMSEPNRAGIIRPENSDEVLMLTMPLMVS